MPTYVIPIPAPTNTTTERSENPCEDAPMGPSTLTTGGFLLGRTPVGSRSSYTLPMRSCTLPVQSPTFLKWNSIKFSLSPVIVATEMHCKMQSFV